MKDRKQFRSNPGHDEKLMLKVKEGDLAAFESIFEAYKGPLGRFFYHLVWDPSLSEDYIQEVFIRLWKGASNYEACGKFSTYLFQIAKNFWINEHKRLKRGPKRYSLDMPIGDDGATRSSQIMSDEATPSTMMANAEMKARIQDALEMLPTKQRLVFVMSEYQGLKYHEIADVLEIPLGTVKSRMSGAEKTLRGKLRDSSPRKG